MEAVPDGLFGIVRAALRERACGRSVVVWEGDGGEEFFDDLVKSAENGESEVWIFHVTGFGAASVPHTLIRRWSRLRLFHVQRHGGWDPSELVLRADVYVVTGGAEVSGGDCYPISRIGRVVSGRGLLVGLRPDRAWVLAAERAGFVGEVGCGVGGDIWAKSFVGKVLESHCGRGGRVAVLGAGLAGSAVADGLARRGVEVDVFDGKGIGQEASGNRAAVMVPMVSMDDGLPARLSRFGFGRVREESLEHGVGQACGVLQIAVNERIRRVCAAASAGEGFRVVDGIEAEELSGVGLGEGGLWFPEAGWVQPRRLCEARLARHEGQVRLIRESVGGVERSTGAGEFRLRSGAGERLGEGYSAVVLATAGIPEWVPWAGLGIGQKLAWGRSVTLESKSLAGLRCVVTGAGYWIPLGNRVVHLGATYEFQSLPVMDDFAAVEAIWEKTGGLVTGDMPRVEWDVRRSVRVLTADRLPMAGALGAGGFFAACGLGSRGVVWSGLVGDLVAAQVMGEPLTYPRSWVEALNPGRFFEGNVRRGRQ